MSEATPIFATVPDELAGRRLDQALTQLFPDYSRSRLQQWIRAGRVLVDDRQWRPRDPVAGGESVCLTPVLTPDETARPEAIPLDIVYADEALLVVNKPAGLVVHPAAGNRAGTLLNALLHYAPELAAIPRAGIVHRLDKDTTGLMVVARSLAAHKQLVDSLQARLIEREYQTVVHGVMTAGGHVDAPVARHPVHRKRMAVRENGREAVTHYRLIHRYRAHTHLQVSLETGRTHQIRVHMAHIRHPVVGDPVYGGRPRIPPQASEACISVLRGFTRQALHAWRLALQHPLTGEPMEWHAPLPADFEVLLAALADDQAAHESA